ASRNKIVPQIKLPIGKIFFTSSNSITGRISSFIKIIRRIEPEVIHFHPGYSSGIYLVLAKLFSKNLTIVHSHSDRRKIDFKISKLRKCYIEIMKFFIGNFSDYRIAVSKEAGDSLFDGDYFIHHCGVPEPKKLIPQEEQDKQNRSSYKIYHIGRDSEAKNYPFILALAESLLETNDIQFYCLGAGLEKIHSEAVRRNINNINFPGFVEDPSYEILLNADLFILPSLWEGLPLSVVEAQKCRIPCLVSKDVTEECNIGLAHFIKLDVHVWKMAIIKYKEYNVNNYEIDNMKFSLENDMRYFKKLYGIKYVN
ncbi:glycosyltransferase, partial [Enterobacter hormaechei]|nr:glycosyltransferase [Enterobacter hormaechei]